MWIELAVDVVGMQQDEVDGVAGVDRGRKEETAQETHAGILPAPVRDRSYRRYGLA